MKSKILGILLLAICSFSMASAQGTKKVLIIGIDGCRSNVLQEATTPNIDALLPNSINSHYALNDDITISGPGWSAMLTGVWSNKHGVTDNGFSGSNYDSYPHFFKRIEDLNPELYTVSISQWHPINNSIVLDHADFKYNAPSEADVTSEAINQLENEDPDVMFLHYDEVDHAGHAYGFSQNVSEYVSAIEGVDTQVGLVLDALYARPNFDDENWLILLSTDHGGLGFSHGGGSVEEETIFYIAHNKSFEQEIINPDTIEVEDLTDCIGNTKHLAFDTDDDMVDIPHFTELNFGSNQDFSIECRVKTSTAADVAIVGNKDWDSGGNKGFVLSFRFASGPEWKINIGDGSNRIDMDTGGEIADNEWHHLAATFDRDGQLSMYEDGVLISSVDMSTIGDIDNGAPFRIGADINEEYDYTGAIEEVRLWKGVIPASNINDWQCSNLDDTHPSYNDLIGYWPLNEGSGTIANDLSALDNNGTITNPTWSALDSIVSYDSTPRITDIAITALDWICIDIEDSWDIDGRSWIDSFPMVNTLIDGDIGSLRSTVENSCPEDSIIFDTALNTSEIPLSKSITIPHNLYIKGNGPSITILSALNNGRHFRVPLGKSLNLYDMTIKDANEIPNGGAIYNQGTLLLKDVVLSDNYEGVLLKAITNEGSVEILNTVNIE